MNRKNYPHAHDAHDANNAHDANKVKQNNHKAAQKDAAVDAEPLPRQTGGKVMISGYYGFGNAGDEAILDAIISWLSDTLGWARKDVVVLSHRPELTANSYGVTAIKRDNLYQVMRCLREATLFISGGGSLLQDATGFKSIPYYLGLIKLAKMFNVPVAFFAQGIGPMYKKINRSMVTSVLNKVDHISVRDAGSLELLKGLGVARDIHLTADAVFILEACSEARVQEMLAREALGAWDAKEPRTGNKRAPLVGVSIRPWQDNKYLNDLEKALNNLIEELGVRIVFFPMHHGKDLPISREMQKKLGPKAQVVEGDYSPREIMGMMQILDFFIGVRLHSLIFAGLMDIPFVGISYDPKVSSFLEKCDTPVLATTEDLNFVDFTTRVIQLYRDKETLWQSQQAGIEEMRQYTQAGFDRLAAFMQSLKDAETRR